MAATALPENIYDTLPWATQPPVNLYPRLAALGSALSGLNASLDEYANAQDELAAYRMAEQNNNSRFLEEELRLADQAKRKQLNAALRESAHMKAHPYLRPCRSCVPTLNVSDSGLAYLLKNFGWQIGESLSLQMQANEGGWRGFLGGGGNELEQEEEDARHQEEDQNRMQTEITAPHSYYGSDGSNSSSSSSSEGQ